MRPLFGIPQLKWITCIAVAEEPYRFVDVQVRGPYRHWWHEHTFIEQDGGTLMKDRVEYELPLRPVGKPVPRSVGERAFAGFLRFPLPTLERSLVPVAPGTWG